MELLGKLNNLLIDIDLLWNHAILFSYNHPNEAIRKVADKCNGELNNIQSEIDLSVDIYNLLLALSKLELTPDESRFVNKKLADYRLNGISLPPQKREELKKINEQINKLGRAYLKNVREGVQTVYIDSVEGLSGLPDDYIQSHKPNENGRIEITTNYPDYQPFMLYGNSDKYRKALMEAFLNRGYPNNQEVIKQLVQARHQKAQILGFDTFADYVTKDKMIKTAENAQLFIDRINELAKPKADKEIARLLKRLQQIDPEAKQVERWQYRYLAEKIKQEEYQIDSKEVRQYFGYEKVKLGIFSLMENMFNIQIKAVTQPVWHEDVESFQVIQDNKLIAQFHLDSHPRPHKYNHAASFPITTGIKGRYLPEAALVTNFPKTYLEHDQVVLFLHEFGHLIHHLFSGNHEMVALAGVNTEVDFIEAPSQMLEEWVWDYDSLKKFAINEEGKVIPRELVKKLNESRNFLTGILTRRQLVYSAMSLGIHDKQPKEVDWENMQRNYFNGYSAFPNVENGNMQASFEHLVGYSAVYYTYTWSKVIAADMFTRFMKEGMINKKTAQEYRSRVLAPGGRKPADQLVKDFLGRDYSFESFKAHLGE
ncbi:M3 family metallopeptidase [Pseudoalteromonas piscicida]